MKNNILVRLASLSDWEQFLPIYKKFLEEVETSHKDIDESGMDQFRKYIDRKDVHFAIALSEEKIIGISEFGIKYARFRDLSPRIEVNSMFVDSSLRGGGVGSKLLEFVENFAIENGYKRIYLNSGYNTEKAHKFYKKHGYDNYGMAFKKKMLGE